MEDKNMVIQDKNTIKLEKKDLKKSWLLWVTFGQACYNYERMQGLGFCHSMKPIIERLYPNDKQGRKEAMKRHLTYYNTENNWVQVLQVLRPPWRKKRGTVQTFLTNP